MTSLAEQHAHAPDAGGDISSPDLASLDQQHPDILAAWETAGRERHRHAPVLHDAPCPLLVTDQWGNIHEVNQAAAALFNLPSQSLIRKPLVVFVPLQEHQT